MIDIAIKMKDALTSITGIQSTAIGIEPNLSPRDYPMIRIVPVEAKPDHSIAGYEMVQIDIYVGMADKNAADGYESIYSQLEIWESEIKTRLNTAKGAAFFWKGTRQDEDRLQNVKVIAMRFEAIG